VGALLASALGCSTPNEPVRMGPASYVLQTNMVRATGVKLWDETNTVAVATEYKVVTAYKREPRMVKGVPVHRTESRLVSVHEEEESHRQWGNPEDYDPVDWKVVHPQLFHNPHLPPEPVYVVVPVQGSMGSYRTPYRSTYYQRFPHRIIHNPASYQLQGGWGAHKGAYIDGQYRFHYHSDVPRGYGIQYR
jgi:hypothetical protein